MENVILANVLTWVAVGILFLLCLPFPRVSKVILEISALGLRLLLLATLVGGVYLYFHPELVSAAEVQEYYLGLSPELQQILPAPGMPLFGLVLAALAVVMYLPALAVLDVTRQLAGQRLRRLRRLSAGDVELLEVDPAVPEAELIVEPSSRRRRVVAVRGSSLHSAADKIASANAPQKQHNRVADYVK